MSNDRYNIIEGDPSKWLRNDQYSDIRPNAVDRAMARAYIRREGRKARDKQIAIVIYDIIDRIVCSREPLEISAKRGGYRTYTTVVPWEWWIIEHERLEIKAVRQRIVQRLRETLPWLDMHPYFRSEQEWDPSVLPEERRRRWRMAFKKSPTSHAHEEFTRTARDLSHKAWEQNRRRKFATTEQSHSVSLYRLIQDLPDDHPVKADPDVVAKSERISEYVREEHRREEQCQKARKAIKEAKKLGAQDHQIEELEKQMRSKEERYYNHEPKRVEGNVYHQAVVNAWLKHFPEKEEW